MAYLYFIIQKILTLSKYGHIALDIFHPYVTYSIFYDIRSFVSRGKGNCKNKVDGTIQILINLLNNKTIILLNLAEYRLTRLTASSASNLVSNDVPRDFAG